MTSFQGSQALEKLVSVCCRHSTSTQIGHTRPTCTRQAEGSDLSQRLSTAQSAAAAARLAASAAECEHAAAVSKIEKLERRAAGLGEALSAARTAQSEAAIVEAALRGQLEAAGRKLVWRQRLMAEVGPPARLDVSY